LAPGTGFVRRVTNSVRRVGVAVPLNGSETSIGALGTIVSQSFTQYDSQRKQGKQEENKDMHCVLVGEELHALRR
jgi:hypothetical protein